MRGTGGSTGRLAFPPFSVAMCAYAGDDPGWLSDALRSVLDQSLRPSEVVLVADGPLTEGLESAVAGFASLCAEAGVPFSNPRLERNVGHGGARRASLAACSHEVVALMDADDLSAPTRFEEEMRLLVGTGADVVGSDIAEFVGDPGNVVSVRRVPALDGDIKEYARRRCPLNQVSAMFRKGAYEAAGGYVDWYCEEDYYLWLRMIERGCVFANTGTTLVSVRVGEDMYRRRGGWRYFASEARLQAYMLRRGHISFPLFLANTAKRLVAQVLLPNSVRGWAYKRFAR